MSCLFTNHSQHVGSLFDNIRFLSLVFSLIPSVFFRLPVSNFARDTLANIESEALFNLESLNQSLYSKVLDLAKTKVKRK